ncbi:MAG: hypothetical protein QG622_505 [Actinomycetota bacterium]|nr:hypothetical protein [Actinomycetota bacterium]
MFPTANDPTGAVTAPAPAEIDVPTGIDLLADADAGVRMRSAMDLGRLRAAQAAPALVERLGLEPEFLIRETLTWAILRLEEEAGPFVDQALSSPRWLARRQAVHVLSKQGRPEDADRLIPLIGDDVDAVASRAYGAAARTHAASVVPALVGQLARGDAEHRNMLTAALAELGESAVPALVGALRGSHRAEVRRHAADSLAYLGSPGADLAALPLAEAVDDPDEQVRLAALNAIGGLEVPFAAEVVTRAARSEEPLLGHLAERLASRHTAVCSRAATVLGTPLPGSDGRILREGTVAAAPGVLVELLCESEVIAGSVRFLALAQKIADLAAEWPAAREPHRLPLDGGTAGEALAHLSWAAGEPLALGRVVRLPGPTVTHLVRGGPGCPARAGALVSFDGGPGAPDRAHPVAVQVAAMSPRYVSRSDVPDDVLAAVRDAATRKARDGSRSEAAVRRVVAGEVESFFHDTVLLDQVSIVDPGRTVDGLLYATGVHITGFERLEVGAGR